MPDAAMFDPERIASLDQIATAVSSVVDAGPATGCRAIDVRVRGGVDVRILPDRGLDVGSAWFAGIPLAWISQHGESPPLDPEELVGSRWGDAWPGGLITTCGLSNVGAPSDGHGLHGTYSHRRARDVTVERTAERVVVTGVVEDWPFLVERRIVSRVGKAELELVDRTRNVSNEAAAAPLLYHVNVGSPLWDEGGVLETEGDVVPRDDDARDGLETWAEPPVPSDDAPERVFEHLLPGPGVAATLRNPLVGIELSVASSLPRLWQWVNPASGTYALGLEPANCSVLGRAADLASGSMPFLDPGDTRVSSLSIQVRSLT